MSSAGNASGRCSPLRMASSAVHLPIPRIFISSLTIVSVSVYALNLSGSNAPEKIWRETSRIYSPFLRVRPQERKVGPGVSARIRGVG